MHIQIMLFSESVHSTMFCQVSVIDYKKSSNLHSFFVYKVTFTGFFIGCFDSHGKCYDVMDEVSFGCNKYRCSMGGNLDLIDSGTVWTA